MMKKGIDVYERFVCVCMCVNEDNHVTLDLPLIGADVYVPVMITVM